MTPASSQANHNSLIRLGETESAKSEAVSSPGNDRIYQLEREVRDSANALFGALDLLDEGAGVDDDGYVSAARQAAKAMAEAFEHFLSKQAGRNVVAEAAVALEKATMPASQVVETLDRQRVLVVDDVSTNRLIFQSMLENSGAYVRLAENGLQAVELFQQEAFDLILMDLNMPIMGGLEAASVIRSDKKRGGQDIPIIAITSNVGRDDAKAAFDSGIDAFLMKPVKRDQLVTTIDDWLKGKGFKATVAKGEDKKLIDNDALTRLAQDTSPAIVPELVETFLIHARSRVEKIVANSADEDMEAIRTEAHALSSSAATFGAEQLYRLAETIETNCKSGRKRAALELVSQLESVLAETDKSLTAYLKTVPS